MKYLYEIKIGVVVDAESKDEADEVVEDYDTSLYAAIGPVEVWESEITFKGIDD